MRQFRPLITAASRRAVEKPRPHAKRREATARTRLDCAYRPATHDVVLQLVWNGLADLHHDDVGYFERNPALEYRLRPSWFMEMSAIGLCASNRPFLLLPPGTGLFTIVPRRAGPGLADRRFVPNDFAFAKEALPSDENALEMLWHLAEPAAAFMYDRRTA